MLVFLIIGLCLSLLTVEHYIVIQFHSKMHRLLPLLFGLISLYYFYLVVEQMTGESITFIYLKDLLAVQMLVVMLYYILDIMQVKTTFLHNAIIFAAVVKLDVMVIIQMEERSSYRNIVVAFIFAVTAIMLAVIAIAMIKKTFSKNAHRVYRFILGAFFLPTASLLLSILGVAPERHAMASSLIVTCLIFNYLLIKDKLLDATSLIKEELFSSIGVTSFLFDSDLFYLDASRSARESFPDIISDLENNPNNYELKPLFESWKGNLCKENDYEHDGKFYKCSLEAVYYRRRLWGFIVAMVDVTQQTEAALDAKEDARQKSSFLARMSHELRSPLHAIIGGSEIVLERDECSERTRNMVGHIHKAGVHLLDLVNSILDFSKLERGKLTLLENPYSIYGLLEEQAGNCIINLKEKPVKFTMNVSTGCPRELVGDETRVREIIQNLLSNAVKFTKEGTIDCNLTFTTEGERVRIDCAVKDTGAGMNEEQLKDVFGEYVTYADNRTTEGTGLGLAIVKQLAELMGGYAKAESDGVSGTTMGVCFYQGIREKVSYIGAFSFDESNVASAAVTDIEFVAPDFTYPRARVLLVDDMEVNRSIFAEMVSNWQFIIDAVSSGEEAISMFEQNDYDLVLLDQMMPGLSGTETIDRLKLIGEKGLKTPVVMLTADITDEMRALSVKHGFADYLGKPINAKRLKKVLETYLPKNKRVPIMDYSMVQPEGAGIVVLESFLEEIKELYNTLKEIYNNNLELFRTKVHGLKGISRQLGYVRLGDICEVFEMAAKAEHRKFIEDHIDMYLSDLILISKNVENKLAEKRRLAER